MVLGINAHVIGNMFQLCITARVFGATVDANVKGVAVDIDAWVKSGWTPNRFNGKLIGLNVHTAGAMVRWLVSCAVCLARPYLGPGCKWFASHW